MVLDAHRSFDFSPISFMSLAMSKICKGVKAAFKIKSLKKIYYKDAASNDLCAQQVPTAECL